MAPSAMPCVRKNVEHLRYHPLEIETRVGEVIHFRSAEVAARITGDAR